MLFNHAHRGEVHLLPAVERLPTLPLSTLKCLFVSIRLECDFPCNLYYRNKSFVVASSCHTKLRPDCNIRLLQLLISSEGVLHYEGLVLVC